MTALTWVARFPPREELQTLAAGVARQPIDPYLQWALTTDFAGYQPLPHVPGDWLSFVAKLRPGHQAQQLIQRCVGAGGAWLHIPDVYGQPIKGTKQHSRFVTGQVLKARLNDLLNLPEIECFELGLPVAKPSAVSVDQSKGPPKPMPLRRPRGRPEDHVIGIIDYGGPFLHPSFRDASGTTRFYSVWDQGTPLTSSDWHIPEGLGYGRELDRRSMVSLTKQALAASDVQVYERLGYALERDDPVSSRVLRDTHGAHVCDMLAGNNDPLAGLGSGIAPTVTAPDVARDAALIFVQIPLPTLVDSSGGSLNVHILDGIRYIVDRAKAKADVVINISYGQHAGPHDGSSLLEQAMDEIVEATSERVVLVIGAGNGRDDGAHAQIDLTSASPETLSWRVPPNDTTDSFLEIWYPSRIGSMQSDLSIQVRPPGGSWSPTVRATDSGALLETEDGIVVAQLIHAAKVPNGKDAMALLSLAPTRVIDPASLTTVAHKSPGTSTSRKPRLPAPVGIWEVRLSTGVLGTSIPVHAWIEREDMPDTASRSEFLSHVSAGCTVNGIATGRRCITVGGIRNSDNKPLPYSGMGPTRGGLQPGLCPTAFSVCEESDALYGIRAGTMRPGNLLRMAGTSVAAPAAARRLFNAIAAAHRPGIGPTSSALAVARSLIDKAGHIIR